MPGLRKIIKYLVALGLYYSGLLYLYGLMTRKSKGRSHHLILMYHRVLDDIDAGDVFTQPGMSVSTRTFLNQLKYLKGRFDLLTVSELVGQIQNGTKTERPALVITFDDGWRDNYTNAFPVLKEHNTPATVFLTTDFIGSSRPFWFLMVHWLVTKGNLSAESMAEIVADIAATASTESEVLAELVRVIKRTRFEPDEFIEACKKLELDTLDRLIEAMLTRSRLSLDYWTTAKPMMTWEEVTEMSRAGIEIGSHGCSHRILTLLQRAEVGRELVDSKKVLEEKLGMAVTSFSYPNGNFDEEIKQETRQAGYNCAVTTSGGKELRGDLDCHALRRLAVHEDVSTGIFGGFSKAMFALHIIRHS